MSIYEHIFSVLDQPMLVLMEQNGEVKVEDANDAFQKLSGYPLSYLQQKNSSAIMERFQIDLTKRIFKSEMIISTRSREQVSIRVKQMPLPFHDGDESRKALLIIEDLTATHWINQQLEKGKVLISGIVDEHLHIRFLHDSLSPHLFTPDEMLEDETLLQFIAESERPRILSLIEQSAHIQEEQSITVKTSKLSGAELELELTFSPITNGFGVCNELAFVIWDFHPANDIDADSGMKLKIWMAKRDVSAGQLSAATGISMQTISKLRNGKIEKPQRLTAELIASELRVDVQDIWPLIRN